MVLKLGASCSRLIKKEKKVKRLLHVLTRPLSYNDQRGNVLLYQQHALLRSLREGG